MRSPRRLRLIEPYDPADAARAASPPITGEFTRVVMTPPAPPWRQRQMAELDARLGAPSAADTITFNLSRQEPWRPGRPGRFAVVYAHANAERRSRPADFAGSPTVGWWNALLESARGRRLLAAAILVASILGVLAAVDFAWERRMTTVATLANLEDQTALAEPRAAALEAQNRQARILDRLGMEKTSPAQVLSDIGWISNHLKPQLTVSGLHWIGGITAVEVAGDDKPFVDAALAGTDTAGADRPVQKSRKPVRPNVWLWGVGPADDPR